MTEQSRLNFLSALGEEFTEVFIPLMDEVCPQDGYEVFTKVLGQHFGPNALRSLSESQVNDLVAFASKWLESTSVSAAQIREVVRRTLFRWPSED